MGVLWTTYPLNDEMQDWLDSLDISYPKTLSRFPTGNEVKEALSELEDVNVTVQNNGVGETWQAFLESKSKPEEYWTQLNVTCYSGDNEEQEIWFEKGHYKLIKKVLSAICQRCGPLVLIPDTGEEPEIIA